MTNKFNLSYVITTRNKIPYLRIILDDLINHKKNDEEIVVVDGASADGTPAYLQELYDKGFIQQFLSEPDKGEAHGTNKGLLMANGELIKIITDDDAFNWTAIQECKQFMSQHPEVDVLGTEGAGTDWSLSDPFSSSDYRVDFQEWLQNSKPFSFCGLGLMIRRNSLSLTGLLHTGFTRVDQEFTLRLTAGPCNLAWYTGFVWVRMVNKDSVSVNHWKRMGTEEVQLFRFYLPETKGKKRNQIGWLPTLVKREWKKLLSAIIRSRDINFKIKTHSNDRWETKENLSRVWLLSQIKKNAGSFLYRKIDV